MAIFNSYVNLPEGTRFFEHFRTAVAAVFLCVPLQGDRSSTPKRRRLRRVVRDVQPGWGQMELWVILWAISWDNSNKSPT